VKRLATALAASALLLSLAGCGFQIDPYPNYETEPAKNCSLMIHGERKLVTCPDGQRADRAKAFLEANGVTVELYPEGTPEDALSGMVVTEYAIYTGGTKVLLVVATDEDRC
jgi:rhodanese-related sulfurtransferase